MNGINTLGPGSNAVRAWGSGPAVLLLHGFPDDADSMADLGEHLAAAGLRAVAPFLPGYGPSPGQRITTLDALGDAVADWASTLGAVAVVGHDWGAAAAYAAAVRHPDRVRRVVGLSVPPFDVLLKNLSLAQIRRSAYMLLFQVPGVEALVRAGDFALVDRLWRMWSPGWAPPAERLQAVKRTLSAPGSLRAALGYYRGLTRSTALLRLARPLPCSARVLVGARDGCMAPEVFAGAPGLVVVPGAGHFLPLEAPDVVAQHIVDSISNRKD